MTGNIQSLPDNEFIFDPNPIVNFIENSKIKTYIYFYGGIVPIVPYGDDSKFLDDVHFSKDNFIFREHIRGSGGTTLLAILATFYSLNDKRVLFISDNIHFVNDFRIILTSLDIGGFSWKASSKTLVGENQVKFPITLAIPDNAHYMSSYDYIFSEFMLPQPVQSSSYKYNTIVNNVVNIDLLKKRFIDYYLHTVRPHQKIIINYLVA